MDQISVPGGKAFTKNLLAWHYGSNDRVLPWKSEKDPYRIWLSEIILQQTRAAQGLAYYKAFTETYRTVTDLAVAPENEVYRLWQGLGYYNRCRNLLASARYIAGALGGVFPADYEGIRLLKGVGAYTAAAIASFAYGLPYAVVDGNVYRLLARYFGIDTPYDTTAGKKLFAELADKLLDKENSAAYNQAIMDFGAVVCTPKSPDCGRCPLQEQCAAYKRGVVWLLPVKSKVQKVTERFFNYIVLLHDGTMWVHQRGAGDIWANLYEPFLIETTEKCSVHALQRHGLLTELQLKFKDLQHKGDHMQRLTHQKINSQFFIAQLSEIPDMSAYGGVWLKADELKKTAFPKTIVSFLENNLYF